MLRLPTEDDTIASKCSQRPALYANFADVPVKLTMPAYVIPSPAFIPPELERARPAKVPRLVQLWDARSEPDWSGLRIADEEHGAVAVGRWRRVQHIVDPEVAIGRECHAGSIRAVLGEESHGFANQRREDAGVSVKANLVASAQQQASAVDADTPVDLHVRPESGDHPDLAGRFDPADNVQGHGVGGGPRP